MDWSGYASCCLLLAFGCGDGVGDTPAGASEGETSGTSSEAAGAGGVNLGSTNAGGTSSSANGGSTGTSGNTGTGGSTGTGGNSGAGAAGARGGSSGAGGTSDAGQPNPPHTVGTCNGLGAPGTWSSSRHRRGARARRTKLSRSPCIRRTRASCSRRRGTRPMAAMAVRAFTSRPTAARRGPRSAPEHTALSSKPAIPGR